MTRDDLQKKLKQHSILNNEEIPLFLNYVDPQKQGYVDFYGFTKKLRRNMVNTNENGTQLIMPYVTPCKEQTEKLIRSMPAIRQEIEANRTYYTPKNERN